MNILVVPTLGLDLTLLERLDASIDHPMTKIVINNGRRGAIDGFISKHQDWNWIDCGGNNGVAGSWNMAPELYPLSKWWMICNNDYWFRPGDLQKMCEFADQNCETEPIIFASALPKASWPCFIWTKVGVERFGTFDENFWPIYYEDCDMMMRHKIAGVTYKGVFPAGEPLNHGKKATGQKYNTMIEACNQLNREYFRKKWGNDEYFGQPAWRTPFNGSGTVGEWSLDVHARHRRQLLFNDFIAQPNPSLYL